MNAGIRTRLCLLACLLGPAHGMAAETMVLGTTLIPPYQTLNNGELQGRSVAILECVFAELDASWKSRLMPWRRARIQMKRGGLDGFFSAMPDAQAQDHARASAPLALEKLYWFARDHETLNQADFPARVRLGGLQGSTSLAWLKRRGLHPDTVVKEPEQLIKLLQTGRIDAYMADIRIIRQAAERLSLPSERHVRRFHQYLPLVAYFSKSLLRQHPGFLERFNSELHDCMGDTFRISAPERQQLKALAQSSIRPWTRKTVVINALRRVNRHRSSFDEQTIASLDRKWKADQGLQQAIADTQISRFLRQQQEQADGLFHEIMVTGRKGLNAGMSQPTSDYWQGDETKFRKTFNPARRAPVIEQIRYDKSTRSFQVHVSLPVREPDTEKLLGVITAGVNIQKALSAVDY